MMENIIFQNILNHPIHQQGEGRKAGDHGHRHRDVPGRGGKDHPRAGSDRG